MRYLARFLVVLVFFVFIGRATAGTPAVTLNVPARAFISETFTFTATFDNTGSTNGFGPFIDLILPTRGIDGGDGITFVNAVIGAGGPLTVETFTFPAGGCVNHPYVVDSLNVHQQVCGTAGDQLIVIPLPFGSFTANQPPIEVTVTAQIHPFADPDAALNIRARGGFRFGNDELNNPCCDPPTVQPAFPDTSLWAPSAITPVVFIPRKTLSTREIASGGSFVVQYEILVDIAAGETITNLQIDDALPVTLDLANPPTVISPAGCTVITAPPLTVNCPSAVGTAATDDVRVQLDVFVPEFQRGSATPIFDSSGSAVNITNSATISGDWVANDPGDGNPVSMTGGANAPVLAARAIAVQKALTLLTDTPPVGAISPADVLQYRLDFQISDYFAFDNAIVPDTISDGQDYDVGSAQLSYTQDGVTQTAALTPTVTVQPDGTTRVVFDVAAALASFGVPLADMRGCVLVAPSCDSLAEGSTGFITYTTTVRDDFRVPPSGNTPFVDQGDTFSNEATLNGEVVSGAGIPPSTTVTDTADDDQQVQRGILTKDVYAYNGNTVLPPTIVLSPGDTITFRLRYELPMGSIEDLTLTDYLPIPMFSAGEVTTFDTLPNAAPPPAGTARYSAADSFNALAGAPDPTLSRDTVANTVMFTYGDFRPSPLAPSVIEILFTVTVTNNAFAGSLSFTNQAAIDEGSTNSGFENISEIISFQRTSPILITRKSLIAASGSAAGSPPIPAAYGFTPPGSGGNRFTNPVTSNALTSNDINSDLGFAAEGEIVSFAFIVENLGNSETFDLTVRDFLPAGFVIPSGGLNLRITRGDGTVLSFNAVNPADSVPLFGAGIEIVDPGGAGACQPFAPATGSNIVVVTYDLQVGTGITGQTLSNASTLSRAAAREGSVNLVNDLAAYADWASVGVGVAAAPNYRNVFGGQTAQGGRGVGIIITDPLITKRGDPFLAQPGEAVTWWIDVYNPNDIPVSNVTLTDRVPAYLELLRAESTAGTLTIEDTLVRVAIGELAPKQTVTLRIFTRVRGEPLPPPLVGRPALCSPEGPEYVENVVCVNYANGEKCTPATVLCGNRITTLPQTGAKAPLSPLFLGILGAAGVLWVVVVWRWLRQSHANS